MLLLKDYYGEGERPGTKVGENNIIITKQILINFFYVHKRQQNTSSLLTKQIKI